ncbi:MAG: helix-turn-helix transcriptional regulator [Firmicutes bacterium]|nr:helix-turn-helix transcriptional regulator [Bacillota bacterium]
MRNQATIPFGEKIRAVRVAKQLSLENVAHAVGYSFATIGRIERGETDCNNDLHIAIKKALGIENAPILDDECDVFKSRLDTWHNLTVNRRLKEANDMKEELSVILHLPFEHKLIALYRIFEAALLLAENNLTDAELCIDASHKCMSEVNEKDEIYKELLYHYNFNKGSLSLRRNLTKEALSFYKEALYVTCSRSEKDGRLYFNMSGCYSKLDLPHQAIEFAKKAYEIYSEDSMKKYVLQINNLLAANYIQIGELQTAKGLIDKCLIQAKGSDDNYQIGMALHNYGCLYMEYEDWSQSIIYFNQAFDYIPKNHNFFLENFYFKLYCFIMEKGVVQIKKLQDFYDMLDEATSLSENNTKYSVLFESLSHLLTLNEKNSHEFIETVTIPCLLQAFDKFKTLDYCKILKEYYKSTRRMQKSLEITEIENDIYRKIVRGEVD